MVFILCSARLGRERRIPRKALLHVQRPYGYFGREEQEVKS